MTIKVDMTESPGSSVIVTPVKSQDENSRIIIGTLLGGAAVIGILLLFCLWRRNLIRVPASFLGGFPMHRLGLARSHSGESAQFKLDPSVLLLYSYDCYSHEKVVITFANYLKFVANCNVQFDIWDQHTIREQGMSNWIQEKVETCPIVFIISSTGARFKCAKNRKLKMKEKRVIEDCFSWAIDYVTEKYRETRDSLSIDVTKFVLINFDYVSESDIPPKIDSMPRYNLMQDMYKLFCFIHDIKIGDDHASPDGVKFDTFANVDYGIALNDALKEANTFFKNNPNWLDQTLEPLQNNPDKQLDLSTQSQQKQVQASKKRNEKRDSSSILIHNMEGDDIPENEYDLKEDVSLDTHVPPNNGKVCSPQKSIPQKSKPAHEHRIRNISKKLKGVETKISNISGPDLETLDVQKDVDFIQNYDTMHSVIQAPDVNIELNGFSPPEEFTSMGLLEESFVKSGGISPYYSLNQSHINTEPRSSSQVANKLKQKSHFVIDFINPSVKSVISENNNLEEI